VLHRVGNVVELGTKFLSPIQEPLQRELESVIAVPLFPEVEQDGVGRERE
jgi:hypothetical protein